MRPGPRIQTAIEILKDLATSDRPAEQHLRDWARKNRYAGSKDRAAIGQLVFDISRHKGRYAFAMGTWDARALMLCHLAESDAPGWRDLFDGSTHAPEPVSEAEEATLSARQQSLPIYARCSVPETLMADIEETFKEDTETELTAMLSRAPVDLRVNTLKSARKPARVHLAKEGIETAPIEGTKVGLRIEDASTVSAQQITSGKAFKAGEFEIQDFGSIWILDQIDIKSDATVVDLCAGGGGKTLGLAARMKNKGKLIACDINSERLANIKPRLKRAGVSNVELRLISGGTEASDNTKPELEDLTASADLVLVDAPCSGSGTWRRHPDAKWRLTDAALGHYQKTQKDLLNKARQLVRPGGQLVYVTCSILSSENAAQVASFLNENSDFVENERPVSDGARKCAHGYQLSPNRTGCDGFYVAFLERAV